MAEWQFAAERENENGNEASPDPVPVQAHPRGGYSSSQPQAHQRSALVNVDNVEDVPPIKGVLNSPRSLEACHMSGILPEEL
eukprot:gene12246-3605_t